MNRNTRMAGFAAAAALLIAAGCGDDDASGDDEYAAFCAAELAAERATIGEESDLEQIQPTLDALVEAAPDDAKDVAERTVAAFQELFASEEGPSEEFDAAYAELIGIVKENCGFAEITVTARDYSFEGLDGVDSGPTVITFENKGAELHQLELVRKNEGVTLSVDELLDLPEEEGQAMVTSAGSSFAFPGATGYAVVDVTPGDYVALCFIPVGATPEAFESGEEPDGPPHFTHGMVVEFEVS